MGPELVKDLEATINNIPCDGEVIGTRVDLSRIMKINKHITRVHYELKESGHLNLPETLNDFEKIFLI